MRLFLFTLLITASVTSNSQVVESGDLTISIGLGEFRGHAESTDTAGYYTSWYLTGRQFPLRAEYVFSKHLSGNISLAYTSWNDRYFDRFEPHNWIDLGIGAGYHIPLERFRVDVATEAEFGYSRYLFRDYDTSGYSEKAKGLFLRGGIAPKIFLGKSQLLGAMVYYRFTYYFMGGTVNTQFTPTYEFDLQGYSHAWGVGIFYRFRSIGTKPYIDDTKPDK